MRGTVLEDAVVLLLGAEDAEVLLVVVDLGPPLGVLYPGGGNLEVDLQMQTYYFKGFVFLHAVVTPFYIVTYYIKWGNYFLDTRYS